MQDNHIQKGGNVHVSIGEQDKGVYVGSASNMARLFIFVCVLFGIIISATCFYFGNRLGIAETKIQTLESKILK